MRIALLVTGMGRGGAEIQVRDLALRFAASGHDVLLVALTPFQEFERELRSGGVETATLNMATGRDVAAALAKLVRLLRHFRPDVLHAHMFAAIIAARLARAALAPLSLVSGRVPVVIGTTHTPFEANPRRYLIYRATDRLSDLWTCVCQEGVDTHERERAVPLGRGVLTSNGIDTAVFSPDEEKRNAKRHELGVADDSYLWFTAGSFRDEQKDYGNLLRAFVESDGPRSNTLLMIAGGGRLLEEKRALARALGIEDKVRFLGLRGDVRELLAAADGFVLASKFEAMPIVLLEAAAMSLPMVCTRVGQNADLVVEGTGFLVPPENAVALGRAMAKLRDATPDERSRLGLQARAHVASHFDLDVIVKGWEERYTELLAQRDA